MSLNRKPAAMERSSCPTPQHLYLQSQEISTKTAISIATMREKTNVEVFLICLIFSFIFDF